jgi:hypothetical protein
MQVLVGDSREILLAGLPVETLLRIEDFVLSGRGVLLRQMPIRIGGIA